MSSITPRMMPATIRLARTGLGVPRGGGSGNIPPRKGAEVTPGAGWMSLDTVNDSPQRGQRTFAAAAGTRALQNGQVVSGALIPNQGPEEGERCIVPVGGQAVQGCRSGFPA